MPDETKNPAEPDRSQVRLLQEDEIRYWAGEFGVTMYELRDAIVATGSRAANRIREYLQNAA